MFALVKKKTEIVLHACIDAFALFALVMQVVGEVRAWSGQMSDILRVQHLAYTRIGMYNECTRSSSIWGEKHSNRKTDTHTQTPNTHKHRHRHNKYPVRRFVGSHTYFDNICMRHKDIVIQNWRSYLVLVRKNREGGMEGMEGGNATLEEAQQQHTNGRVLTSNWLPATSAPSIVGTTSPGKSSTALYSPTTLPTTSYPH